MNNKISYSIIGIMFVVLFLNGCGPTGSTMEHTDVPVQAASTNTPIPLPTDTPIPTKPDISAGTVTWEKISFQSGHFNLAGTLRIPPGDGDHPLVIMVHGDGLINRTNSGRYEPIMEHFLSAGYAVMSWDKPGTGESTGEFEHHAWIITDRAAILVDAVRFAQEHPAIDSKRIGVWGISQGGIVIPMALSISDEIAFAIIVSGPGMDSIDQMAYLIGEQMKCVGYSEDEADLVVQSFSGLGRAAEYHEYKNNYEILAQFPPAIMFTEADMLAEEDWLPWDRKADAFFDPITVIEQTTIPVLAFFGEKDTQVDPFQGVEAYTQALQRAGNQHYRVELISGVDHVLAYAETGCMDEYFPRVYATEYLELLEAWLAALRE